MAEVLTVGETMAVLAPLKMGALRYQNTYEIRVAGAESNTAIGLAKLGKSAAWISRLGEDELGERILMALRAEGVDCSAVKRDREYQTGLMFKEMDGRDTRVFYYRKDSAASCMDEFDVEPSWFSGVRIVHLTGITPVLSPSCCRMIQRVALLAERYGVMLSFDPNIRKRLWKNADYTELLRTLTLQAQIVEIGREEAEILFGTREDKAILDALFCEGRAQWVAIKDGGRGAVVADRKERVDVPPFPWGYTRPLAPETALMRDSWRAFWKADPSLSAAGWEESSEPWPRKARETMKDTRTGASWKGFLPVRKSYIAREKSVHEEKEVPEDERNERNHNETSGDRDPA